MIEALWTTIRSMAGHFHPALVHFPVALVLTGAGLESWQMFRRKGPSQVSRLLLLLGFLGALAAVGTGLALFHPGDYRGRTLVVVTIHRALAIAATLLVGLAAALSGKPSDALHGRRLTAYRIAYGMSALFIGLTGHYGGWAVFGWGSIWTF